MLDSPGMIVIDSTKEKNENLKEKWSKVNKISTSLNKLASSGFIVSMLSPFDFEGPVVEIVTAVVAGVSFIGKKVSQYKLDEFSRESTEIIDSNDKDTLVTIAENIGSVVSSRNR